MTASPTASTAASASSSSSEKRTGHHRPKPLLPLPDRIRSDVPGTWAYDTMSRRVDGEILERTWLDNEHVWKEARWSDALTKFQALRGELQSAASTRLTYLGDHETFQPSGDESYDDADAVSAEELRLERQEWREILQPYVEANETWLSAPWMVTEFYVYRRLMAAIGYFDPASPGYKYDPFEKQKRAGLVSSIGSAEPMLGKIPRLTPDSPGLVLAASIALWGNKMDLSLWPANVETSTVDVFTTILGQAAENLLHDDSSVLAEHCHKLQNRGGGNVDIVVDNAGFELVTDLALATYLVQSGIARTVTFQLKSHPTFVSDALAKDLLETVAHYRDLDALQYPNAHRAGVTWQQFLENGSWQCREHRFWVQPYAMWDMTEPLRTDLAQRCDMTIVKGDANYRRLLGDLKWSYSSDFQQVVGCYFPCPVLALRTLKAELGCGMDEAQVERARQLDHNWLVNGRFGVIQFGTGASPN
jgi:Damage-control phosphatase ARMT1-like domain